MILGRQPLWTGVAISLVAFFWALVYLPAPRAAAPRRMRTGPVTAVMLLAAYPFALFFSAAYTEALFLLALLGASITSGATNCGERGGWGLLAG